MTGGQHQPKYRRLWTKEQEDYLKQRRQAGIKIKDIAAEMGLSHRQVKDKLYAQKKPRASRASRAEPRKPPANATQWAGGAYWRQPPARTWHKGITGRLIHLSATHDDTEDDDEKKAQ